MKTTISQARNRRFLQHHSRQPDRHRRRASGAFGTAWIEEVLHEGISGGCGGGNYCPTSNVNRQQMAVFLLKASRGSGYNPPACTGLFGDVACPGTFTNWIERLSSSRTSR